MTETTRRRGSLPSALAAELSYGDRQHLGGKVLHPHAHRVGELRQDPAGLGVERGAAEGGPLDGRRAHERCARHPGGVRGGVDDAFLLCREGDALGDASVVAVAVSVVVVHG